MRKYLYLLATDKSEGIFDVVIKKILFVLSLIYGFVVRLIFALYRDNIFRSRKLNCKVISIGNIVLGGTGKTPLEETVAIHLLEKGKKIAISTRGYGSKNESASDEALLLRENLKIPILEGRDRFKKAVSGINNYKLDTIILDDGFQHWKIKRDLDIVVVDASNPFGNNYLIPRGILREEISSLGRADVIVLSKFDKDNDFNSYLFDIRNINPNALIIKMKYESVSLERLFSISKIYSTDDIKGKKVCVVSGIGDPEYFEKQVRDLGAILAVTFRLPDHHRYGLKDFRAIVSACNEENIDKVLLTQKDAVKFDFISPVDLKDAPEFLILKIKVDILEKKDEFFDRIDNIYSI